MRLPSESGWQRPSGQPSPMDPFTDEEGFDSPRKPPSPRRRKTEGGVFSPFMLGGFSSLSLLSAILVGGMLNHFSSPEVIAQEQGKQWAVKALDDCGVFIAYALELEQMDPYEGASLRSVSVPFSLQKPGDLDCVQMATVHMEHRKYACEVGYLSAGSQPLDYPRIEQMTVRVDCQGRF